MKGNVNRKAESGPKGSSLTRKQETGIAALLAQPTMKEAAAVAGVTEVTMWRWLQDDNFQAAYMQARRESVRHAMTRLQATTGDAVDTLGEIMRDAEAPKSVRVMAAKAVIEYAIKAVEIEDMAERVGELEALFEQQQKRKA